MERELLVVITSGSLSPWPCAPGAGAGVRVMAGITGGPISGRGEGVGPSSGELPSTELLRVLSHNDSSASLAVLFSPPPITDPPAAPPVVRAGKAGGAVRRRGGAE